MSSELAQAEHEHAGPEEKIHLFVENVETSESVVAVRWCFCKSVKEELAREKVNNPFLLLIVTYNGREIERKCVPLEQEMEYIWFQRSDSHKIFAAIIWPLTNNDGTFSYNAYDGIFGKDTHKPEQYKRKLVDSFGRKLGADFHSFVAYYLKGVFGETMIEIVIPEGVFAKEPSKWIWSWVNLLHETLPRDECQFRRRFLYAFSLKPFFVSFLILTICAFRACLAFIFILYGMRKITFSPVVHPFDEPARFMWDEFGNRNSGSVFLSTKEGNRCWFCFVSFMPIVWLPLMGIGFLLSAFLLSEPTIKDFLMVPVCAVFGPFIVLLLGELVIRFLECIVRPIIGERMNPWEREERKRAQKEQKWQVQFDSKFSGLVCRGEPVEAKLRALPKKSRTIYLRYRGLKARVCRPFARR